jgi:WD40 repeat protein
MLDRSPDRAHDDAVQRSPWPLAPFPGLRPFEVSKGVDESLIFYGRNADKDEILARLNSNHLVFVVGPSGCGKSSLVKAGVIPALEAGLLTQAGHNWRTTEMRPGERPLRYLAGALARLRSSPEDRSFVKQIYKVLCKDKNGLWMVVESLCPRADASSPLLLLIDQFEEVFGPQVASQDEVKRFLECIIRFCEKPHPNLYCIVTMRTDFLGRSANFPQLADVINATLFVTPVLRAEELEKVIALPPDDYHAGVDPNLVREMVSDMTADVTFDPDRLPLMQHALLWLWNKALTEAGLRTSTRPDQKPPAQPISLKLEHYERSGRLKGILNEHAEALFGALSDRNKQVAEILFRRLSERDAENRYRRAPATASAICALAGCTRSELNGVVSIFAKADAAFLSRRPVADKDDELLDVSHEALIRQWDRLRKWADDEADKVRSLRDLARSAVRWDRSGRSRGYFKKGDELQFWSNWWNKYQPTAEWVQRYHLHLVEERPLPQLFALTEEYLERNRQSVFGRRRMTIGAIAAGLVLLWVGSAALVKYDYNKTVATLNQAKALILAARGEEMLEREGATRSLLVAISGLDGATTYTPELERLAYKSLQDLREQKIFMAQSQFSSSSFSPNGEVVVLTNQGQMQFWNVREARQIATASISGFPAFIRPRWSENGEWIVVGSGDGKTVLFAPCSQAALRPLFGSCGARTDDLTRLIGPNDISWPSVVSRDGRYLLSGSFGVPPRLWDLRQQNPEPIKVQDRSAGWAIAFHPQGSQLAVGATDGTVRIYSTANPPVRLQELSPGRAGSPEASCHSAGTAPLAAPPGRPSQLVLPVTSLAFHPTDPDLLVATTNDGTVRLWNVRTAKILRQCNIPSPGFATATFSSNGNLIAITSEAGPVVWDLKASDRVTLRGHRYSTWMVDFGQTNDLLVSASSDSTRVWSMQPALRATQSNERDIARPSGAVSPVDGKIPVGNKHVEFPLPYQALAAVSADSTRVLLASRATGDIKLFDSTLPAEPIAVFQAPNVEWREVGFLTNPDRVVGISSSGIAYSWPYFKDRKALIEFARKHLPRQDGQRADLSAKEECRLGIRPPSSPACEQAFAQGGPRPQSF